MFKSNEEFTETAAKYMDMIFRIAISRLGNPDDANDITQDVLVKLYKTDKEFESDSHIKNWLIRVTLNQCKTVFRSPWHFHENIDDYAETLGFEKEEDKDLFRAVMKLDKKYRLPLILFYYEGYSTSEIASIMNIPANTVSTRLRRAKEKLKSFLTED